MARNPIHEDAGISRGSSAATIMRVREQLDGLLSRMQEMLIDDAALDATALEELVALSQRVEAAGKSGRRGSIADAAKRLTATLRRALVTGNYTNVVTRLDLWHRLIALKHAVRELT